MKKKLLLIIVMFLFITNVNALTFNVGISNIEDKGNNNTHGSIESIDLENKTINTLFKAVDDEVNFEITVTNSGDRVGTLKEITIVTTNDKIEYSSSLPEGGLAIDGNGTNKITINAKLKDGAVNGTNTATLKFKYDYSEGSCPDGETLSDDETKCLCPEGKERNTQGVCVVPEKKIECADDEVYNEETKTCEKKVVPTPTPVIPENPKTLDNIVLITLLFILSGLGIYAILFKKLKTSKQRKIVGTVIVGVTIVSALTVLTSVFGTDKLLGAVINPVSKSTEVTLTINEEIDLLPVSKQMQSEDGAHYLYEGKPFIGTGVGGLIISRDIIGTADYSSSNGVYHRDTRTYTFPDSPAADMAEEYCTGCRLMTKKEAYEWDGDWHDSYDDIPDKRATSGSWWLADPFDIDDVAVIEADGNFAEGYLSSQGVRPAVTISGKAVLTGTGTEEDPYIIDCGNINCSLVYNEDDVPSSDTRERVTFQNIDGAYYKYEYETHLGWGRDSLFVGTGVGNLIIVKDTVGRVPYYPENPELNNDITYNYLGCDAALRAERYCTGCRLMTKEEALSWCPEEGEEACEKRTDSYNYELSAWLSDYYFEQECDDCERVKRVWTMSNYDGDLYLTYVDSSWPDWEDAVRPVVSIPDDATMSGSGTEEDPYVIYK